MTCANCASKVEKALRQIAPSATVTLDPPRVVMAETVSRNALNAALAGVGKYRVGESASDASNDASSWIKTYYPLLLVIGLIAVASAAGGDWMAHFMAGFFIIFGGFKLLDVRGFADAYGRYDLIAKVFRPWALVYPIIETALGFAVLFHLAPVAVLWVALVLSLVGAAGVIKANLAKETIQCACLGAVFKLPMSVVTIIEDLGMAAMAAWMLFVR